MSDSNFRVVEVAGEPAVEVDVTLTIKADAIMRDFQRILRDVQGIDGVIYTKIDDLPLAIVRHVRQSVDRWNSDE